MIIFGLTGGIASGKSFVANLLAEKGAKVIDADQIAHKVLAKQEVLNQLADRWGNQIIQPDGLPNRSEIAKIVFSDAKEAAQEKKFLEGIVHPKVRSRIGEELLSAKADGFEAAVLDIPLLHESGWSDRCDLVLHIDTPREVRQCRAAKRGWSSEEHAKREATQLSIEEKLSLADHIICGENQDSASSDISKIWDKTMKQD